MGRIRVLQNGQLLDTSFLDFTDRVGNRGNEQGLLGLAFHSQYQQHGRFFVNYTDKNGNTVIARFQVTSDANIADAASEVALLHVNQPFPNHNGGTLNFGPDGYLYAGLGDGGSGGDPFGNAQNLNTLLGKILRLDVDRGEPYRIPPDNPFGSEIWAYGLRNHLANVVFPAQSLVLGVPGKVIKQDPQYVKLIRTNAEIYQNLSPNYKQGIYSVHL